MPSSIIESIRQSKPHALERIMAGSNAKLYLATCAGLNGDAADAGLVDKLLALGGRDKTYRAEVASSVLDSMCVTEYRVDAAIVRSLLKAAQPDAKDKTLARIFSVAAANDQSEHGKKVAEKNVALTNILVEAGADFDRLFKEQAQALKEARRRITLQESSLLGFKARVNRVF